MCMGLGNKLARYDSNFINIIQCFCKSKNKNKIFYLDTYFLNHL